MKKYIYEKIKWVQIPFKKGDWKYEEVITYSYIYTPCTLRM